MLRVASKFLAMTGLSQTITQEIRAEMARQRLSQHALAERLGWTQGYLNRRLTADVSMSIEDLEAIARGLGIPLLQVVWPGQTTATGSGR
jgi:transcriptional regulator with XRE-family HTH domain